MLSPGHLPRPCPNMGDGLPKFVPTGDDNTLGAIHDFLAMPAGIGIPMDSAQEDLPDLLRDMRGEGPSRWGMDAPSFGELEPTQCFPSATAAWGSGAFGCGNGGGGALAFGAGPSETFGAFGGGPQHQGQITDTAGTPFHPTTMPMVSMPYGQIGQMQMMPPMHLSMMPPGGGAAGVPMQATQYRGPGNPNPPPAWVTTMTPAAAAAAYGFAPPPPPPPPPFVNCTAFPPGMPLNMMNMAMAMQMQQQQHPMACPPFPPSATTTAAVPTMPTATTGSAPPAVVPSASPPLSLTGAYNNNNGMCNDGSSSGDEVAPHAGPSCLLPRRNINGSMSSDDSGQHGNLQVVPDRPGAVTTANINAANVNANTAAACGGAHQVAGVFPAGAGSVVLVPYNGGLMAVRRPVIAPTTAAVAAAMLNHGGNNLAASASTAALPMLGVPVGSTRAASLQRYRQKKASRSYSKHIRYHMRKVNADRRPRVKGRFIKASVVAEAAETLNNEMDAGDV